MPRKFLEALCATLLFTLLCTAQSLGAQRHADLPLSTDWQTYHLGEAAKKSSGLDADTLAVLFFEPDTGWYAYDNVPQTLGKPTRLSATLDGKALSVRYPHGKPKPDPVNPGGTVLAYAGRTPLFVPLPEGASGKIAASLDLLLCMADKCLPAKVEVSYDIPKGPLPEAAAQPWWPRLLESAAAKSQPEAASPAPELAAKAQSTAEAQAGALLEAQGGGWSQLKPRYLQPELEVSGLLKAALLGLLAGFVLNFMPCVLPVISIKLSALMAGGAHEDQAQRSRHFREHNIFFALGILLYFLMLSILLGATGLAWGQLFQKQGLVLALAALVFALALSLFGVFSLPVVDLKVGGGSEHPRKQALFTGLVATLLATPCSGPFLGGVLGWTLLQPAWVIAVVLACVGLGMALPYLVLAAFPALARLFPKPGPWTGHLEKAVGLLLMATCMYLLAILPQTRLIHALALLWCTAAAAWLWGLAGPGFDSRRALVLKALALSALALGVFVALRPAAPAARMDAFDAASLRAKLGKETVVVDFTADWCPSCKVLEQTVLTPERLGDMKSKHGLALMRADLTEPSLEAEALLHALGSQSIPALAIFPKDAPDRPLVLRDLFTAGQLEQALAETSRP